MRLAIIALVAAQVWLQCQPELPRPLPWLLLAITALPLVRLPYRPLRQLGAMLFAIGIGLGSTSWRAAERLADRLDGALEQQTVQLTGQVASLPQPSRFGPRFRFRVEAGPAGVPSHILLADYQHPPSDWQPGQRWRLDVRLKRPHGNANPGGSDYEAWLLAEGIGATGTVQRSQRQLIDAFVYSPRNMLNAARQAIAKRIRQELSTPVTRDAAQATIATQTAHPFAEVIVALAIGEQTGISTGQWQLFRNTGITHLASISGLHITMIASLFAAMVSSIWRRSIRLSNRLPARHAALLAGVVAAFAYTLLAGFQVPSQRTFFMLAISALALYSSRSLPVSLIWLLALGATVLLDPWAVLSPGFWLSYLTVGAMLWALAGRGRLPEGWRTSLQSWGASQWAATLGSAPLLLLLFQQLPLVSPLANAIAIPLISMLTTPLCLLGLLDPSGTLLRLSEWSMQLCMFLLAPLAGKQLLWQQAAPPAWALLPALLGVAIWLLPRGVPGKLGATALFLPMALPLLPTIAPGNFTATVWDVGQGLSVLVRSSQHNLLFDAGPEGGGGRLLPGSLRAAGVAQLDVLVLSHNDGDHIDGAHAVLANLDVDRIAGVAPRAARADELPFAARPVQPCLQGQHWQWDGVSFTFLRPPADMPARASDNAKGCVLLVRGSGGALLIPADIGQNEEAELLASQPDIMADVLVMPHHGSNGSSSARFIEAVHPRLAIATNGYRNPFRHPRPEVLARYAQAGSQVWRSDRDGAIVLAMDAKGWQASRWRQVHRRYWHADIAGSLPAENP